MIYYPSGCDQAVPQHDCNPCEEKEKGRIGSVAFIKRDFEFTDPTNPVEWRNGIDAHDIIMIPQVLGSFDGGSEVESTGYGRQASNLVGYNFTANFKDPNYVTNCEFYNALKNSRQYRFAYVTSRSVHITTNPVTVIPKNPVTEDLNSDVVWDVTVKWSEADLPCPFAMPAGIFDECVVVYP